MSRFNFGYRRSTRAKRVSNHELRRAATRVVLDADALKQQGAKTFAILLAVLGQSGGEVTVTKGTIDQVGQNLASLSYAIAPGKTPNEYIVRLVEGVSDETTNPADAVPDGSLPVAAPGTTIASGNTDIDPRVGSNGA